MDVLRLDACTDFQLEKLRRREDVAVPPDDEAGAAPDKAWARMRQCTCKPRDIVIKAHPARVRSVGRGALQFCRYLRTAVMASDYLRLA